MAGARKIEQDAGVDRRAAAEAAYRRDGGRFTSSESHLFRWARPSLEYAAAGGRALDLGCGPGRDCLALARLGFETIGVDQAPTALARAHGLARAEGKGVLTFVEADLVDFLEGQPESSATLAWSSLAYATLTTGELGRVGRALARVLARTGRHFYSVRDASDPNAREGTELEPGVRIGGPHAVPYRYFDRDSIGLLQTPELTLVRSETIADRHLLFVEAVRG